MSTYQYRYYNTAAIPKSPRVLKPVDYRRFRLAVGGGYSYRVAKISDAVPGNLIDHTKKLKSGYHLGVDAAGYFSEFLGAGLKCSFFGSSHTVDNSSGINAARPAQRGKWSEEVKIIFVGPTFSTRFVNASKKNCFLMNLSLGYMGYSNNVGGVASYKLKGNTLGAVLDFGYDIGLSKGSALGFGVSLVAGTLSQVKFSDGRSTERIKLGKDEYEGLARIDFSVGLRFGK